MTEPDAAACFRRAIEKLRMEIAGLECEPIFRPVGDRLHKARLELAIAEAELGAIEAVSGPNRTAVGQ